MKKIMTLVMALAVMVSASVYAQSSDNRRERQNNHSRMEQQHRGHSHQEQCPRINRQKNGGIDMSKLSEAQRKEVDEINRKYSIQLSDLSLDIKKQENVIKAEMMKDEPSKETIDAAIDAGSSLKAQRTKLVFEKKLAIKAIVDAAK